MTVYYWIRIKTILGMNGILYLKHRGEQIKNEIRSFIYNNAKDKRNPIFPHIFTMFALLSLTENDKRSHTFLRLPNCRTCMILNLLNIFIFPIRFDFHRMKSLSFEPNKSYLKPYYIYRVYVTAISNDM